MLKEKITREILNKGYSGEFLYRFGKNFGNLYDNFEKQGLKNMFINWLIKSIILMKLEKKTLK